MNPDESNKPTWTKPVSPMRVNALVHKLDKLDVVKEKHLLHEKKLQQHPIGGNGTGTGSGKVAIAPEEKKQPEPLPLLHLNLPSDLTKLQLKRLDTGAASAFAQLDLEAPRTSRAPQSSRTKDPPPTSRTKDPPPTSRTKDPPPTSRTKDPPPTSRTARPTDNIRDEQQPPPKKNLLTMLKADAEKQMLTTNNNKLLGSQANTAKGVYGVLLQSRAAEELCTTLALTIADIRKLKRRFDDNDLYKSGEITQEEFFLMIREDRRRLTTGMLRLGHVDENKKYLNFDQYLMIVVTFAVMSKPELYRYVFDVYDADKSGALDEREFEQMSLDMQNKQFSFPKNVTTALKMIGKRRGSMVLDGLVDLDDFTHFTRKYPIAFYAIINLQKNVRETTLGNRYWARVTSRKLHVANFLNYMRRNGGLMPRLTWKQRLWDFFTGDFALVQTRAVQQYHTTITHMRLLQHQRADSPSIAAATARSREARS